MSYIAREKAIIEARLVFLNASEAARNPIKPDAPYGCQQYDAKRLCRFDRRAIDRKCDGCPRTTDQAYLVQMGLWVDGVAYG